MGFTAAQIATGSDYTLESFDDNPPEDQINIARPTLDWLIKNSTFSSFGNGFHNEGVYISNDSNYQNYWGADAVTYNERDPVDWARYPWYNNHDGFWFDEDRLMANGITLTEDESDAVPTQLEKERLVDLLKISHTALKNSILDGMAMELLRDGVYDAKAAPGLAHIVHINPASNTVGGIAGTNIWWRNNTNIDIPNTTGALIPEMDISWRATQKYGGSTPNAIFAGEQFLAHYRKEANETVNRQISGGGVSRGGVSIDPSTNDVYYMGVLITWDPMLDALDDLLGVPNVWSRSAYMLNGRHIKLRKLKNNWMRKRRPRRLPDRYVHYWGQTSKYALTTNKRRAHAILRVL